MAKTAKLKEKTATLPEGPLPSYENPPVNDVVCGVLFKALDKMLTPHLGVLWDSYRADYPTCQEAPPLIPIIERFGERPAQSKPEFAEIPPLPRVWFVHTNGNGLIQIQRDRFLHNWRRLRPENPYPRYEQVIAMFQDRLATFQKFLTSQELGTLVPLQYEMTYVNHIYKGEGWKHSGEVGKIFADFVWRDVASRFLPQPEAINWRTTFTLPNNQGRLHVSIQNAESREDDRPLCNGPQKLDTKMAFS